MAGQLAKMVEHPYQSHPNLGWLTPKSPCISLETVETKQIELETCGKITEINPFVKSNVTEEKLTASLNNVPCAGHLVLHPRVLLLEGLVEVRVDAVLPQP